MRFLLAEVSHAGLPIFFLKDYSLSLYFIHSLFKGEKASIIKRE